MFLYEKKIVYLSLFRDGSKKAAAGFVRLSREKDGYMLDIHIKSGTGIWDGKHTLFLIARSREIEWGSIKMQNGGGTLQKYFSVREGFARFGEEEFAENDLCGLLIHLDRRQWIAGYWENVESACEPMKQSDLIAADESAADKTAKSDIIVRTEEGTGKKNVEEREFLAQPALEDKWEQLQRCYKKIHPFGNERTFLSIEPKDFIILQAPYHRLVNNSFLLHGFYNYRHMILGPDKEIGNENANCFYLGVPGTYFEREKMVAIMFGFEGFECDGAVEIGKFGYYMRRVEL